MRITCAISGIKFDTAYLEGINLPHKEGYFHPVFAVPYRTLHHLYIQHCKGELTSNDSYLLFCAFLHSSGKIEWKHPATLKPTEPSTRKLIENNIAQLIRVLEKTAIIKHPSFRQPSFKVTLDTSSLEQIPNWISAWEQNIEFFQKGLQDIRVAQSLQEVENKLSYHIISGAEPAKYSHIIAKWASQAAGFPLDKDENWQKIIRSCFNITKMFNTPLPLLKEIKDYCECNIEAGSIHFHALSEVLKEGIARHVDYLGGSALATGYILLPTLTDSNNSPSTSSTSSTSSSHIALLPSVEQEKKSAEELLTIVSNAPTAPPIVTDYPDTLSFLKAKLAFRVAKNIEIKELRNTVENPINKPTEQEL